MDLTESEDIKKRLKEYIELYKKDINDPDNHDGVITHLELDILECEVNWALESITTTTELETCGSAGENLEKNVCFWPFDKLNPESLPCLPSS